MWFQGFYRTAPLGAAIVASLVFAHDGLAIPRRDLETRADVLAEDAAPNDEASPDGPAPLLPLEPGAPTELQVKGTVTAVGETEFVLHNAFRELIAGSKLVATSVVELAD